MLVDADVTIEEAGCVSQAVLSCLRERRLISAEPDARCVLGGEGYRPGLAVANLYELGEREHPFWEWRVCGVEAEVGRGFNVWALGPVCKGLVCPSCSANVDPFQDTG